MFPDVLFPLIAALALAVTVTALHRRLPPALAARAVIVSVIIIAAAAAPTILIVAASYIGHLHVLDGRLDWCQHMLGAHHSTPSWAGIPAMGLCVVGAFRVVRVLRLHRRLRHDHLGDVEVAGHDAAFAFTLPGRGGHVIVSSGLIDLLSDAEQRVVLAHERAHARYRHDRYLLIGHLAAASVPFLRPLASRLQFSLERWADEAAVDDNQGDRHLVAATLGKVALNTVSPLVALGFNGVGVPARVAALLAPAPPKPTQMSLAAMWSAIALVAAFAAYQLHHLLVLIVALCPD